MQEPAKLYNRGFKSHRYLVVIYLSHYTNPDYSGFFIIILFYPPHIATLDVSPTARLQSGGLIT